MSRAITIVRRTQALGAACALAPRERLKASHSKSLAFALILASAFTALPASAQKVYRCGSAYSDAPCVGGAELPPGPTPPTAAQSRANDEATRRAGRTADQLEKSRLQLESRAAPAYIPPPRVEDTSTASPRPAVVKAKRPKKELPHFMAVAPKPAGDKAPKKKKRKASA